MEPVASPRSRLAGCCGAGAVGYRAQGLSHPGIAVTMGGGPRHARPTFSARARPGSRGEDKETLGWLETHAGLGSPRRGSRGACAPIRFAPPAPRGTTLSPSPGQETVA